MKARKRGLSIEMIAGASTSAKSRIAASPPSPSSVMVAPAWASSSAAVRGPSSGTGCSRRRSREYSSAARATRSVSSV
jgi:hypothetical protein